MIERKFQRPLQLFSWVACGAMAVKLVFFTEYNARRPGQPHALTEVQAFADRKLDEFFGVGAIVDKAAATKAQEPSVTTDTTTAASSTSSSSNAPGSS